MKLNKKGFTLIELMVVIAIIAILATVVLVSLQSARNAAEDAERASVINQVRSAAEVALTQSTNFNYDGLDDPPTEPLQPLVAEHGHADDYAAGSDDGILRIRVAKGTGVVDYSKYCAQIESKSTPGEFYCVDSTLSIRKEATTKTGGPCFEADGTTDLWECIF